MRDLQLCLEDEYPHGREGEKWEHPAKYEGEIERSRQPGKKITHYLIGLSRPLSLARIIIVVGRAVGHMWRLCVESQ